MPHRSRWSVDLPFKSLPSLVLDRLSHFPQDAIAFADADEPDRLHMNWSDYVVWCKRLAAGLLQAGLQPGDRVLVYSGNNIFFPVVFMGVILAGGIITTANPAYVARELAYQLKDATPRFVLATEASVETATQAANLAEFKLANVFLFDDRPLTTSRSTIGSLRHWDTLLADLERGQAFHWQEASSEEHVMQTVAILYSSGTTGVPKGVELTHRNLVANCVQLHHLWDQDPRNRMPARLLAILPMYHGLGLLTFATIAPFRRSTTYVMKRYKLTAMLEHIQRFRITELTLVPPILITMAKLPQARHRHYDLSSVQKIQVGAAPLSYEMCREFDQLWPEGKMNVKQGWGMTECPTSILGWDDRDTSTTQAVGEPITNCQVKLMDEEGLQEVPVGQPGELWCKAPNVMKGYWGKPEETHKIVTPDGWLMTGDIAYADADGKYVIVDRKKELIKVKGNQVAPAELEALLLEHPAIDDAAVIGIKCEEDEEPLGFVVKKARHHCTAENILAYMAERTAKIKRLTGGIIFCDSIPRNPSGKILRRALREQVLNGSVAATRQSLQSDGSRFMKSARL